MGSEILVRFIAGIQVFVIGPDWLGNTRRPVNLKSLTLCFGLLETVSLLHQPNML
jgi:hypothetical protein